MMERNIAIDNKYHMPGDAMEKAESKTVRDFVEGNHPKFVAPSLNKHEKLVSSNVDKFGLYQKTLSNDDHHPAPQQRRRPRYQRRNSAVASMLFPSMSASSSQNSTTTTTTTTPRSPVSTLPTLNLSPSLRNLDPLEALNQARKVLDSLHSSSPLAEEGSTRISHHGVVSDNLTGLTGAKREKDSNDWPLAKRQRTSSSES